MHWGPVLFSLLFKTIVSWCRYIRVTVQNNARNVQIPLDNKLGLNVTVGWAAAPERFTHAQFGMGISGNEF